MFENCRPDLIVDRVERLDQDDLWARGVRGIVLDLDNTLCTWHGSDLTPERMAWLQQAKTRFKLCILSNTIKFRRLRRVSEAIGIPGVARWGIGRKPFAGGFRAALKLLGTMPGESLMVGDQIFADILGGNRAGMTTAWVQRLDTREFISTRLVRAPEQWVLRRLGCDIPARPPDRT
jgi:uncharacterized protein